MRELALHGRVRFLGRREDVAEILAACDALVLPTHFDAFPNVVLEGLASGLPALVSRHTGAAEVVTPGQTGWVVEEVAEQPLVHALKDMLAIEDLAPWRSRARARAERHTWPAHMEALYPIYEEQAAKLRRHGEAAGRAANAQVSAGGAV